MERQATDTAAEDTGAAPVRQRPGRRAWIRRVVAVVLLGLAAYEAYQRRSELGQAVGLFDNIDTPWLAVAIAAEAGSMVVFARLQRWLLRAGGVDIRLREMAEITLAGNAMGTSLPGGAAWAATWAFGQLRRRGADRILAGWVILVAGALSSFAIFLVVASGAWVAGSKGPVANLRWLAAGLAAIPLIVAGAAMAANRSMGIRRAVASSWFVVRDRLPGARPAGRFVGNVFRQLDTVRPGPLGWLEAFGLALANWLEDAACMTACILALHVRVPWQGLLVIYGLTQISASLPVTPGGLGVVEGSMAALLTAYGTHTAQALAVVLLYRIVSFWGLVPIGWITWSWLELHQRGGGRPGRPHPWAYHYRGTGPRRERLPRRGPERILPPSPHQEPGTDDGSPSASGRRIRSLTRS